MRPYPPPFSAGRGRSKSSRGPGARSRLWFRLTTASRSVLGSRRPGREEDVDRMRERCARRVRPRHSHRLEDLAPAADPGVEPAPVNDPAREVGAAVAVHVVVDRQRVDPRPRSRVAGAAVLQQLRSPGPVDRDRHPQQRAVTSNLDAPQVEFSAHVPRIGRDRRGREEEQGCGQRASARAQPPCLPSA